jgi:hypothetical protein
MSNRFAKGEWNDECNRYEPERAKVILQASASTYEERFHCGLSGVQGLCDLVVAEPKHLSQYKRLSLVLREIG